MSASVSIKLRIPEWLDRICAWPVLMRRRRLYGYAFRKIPLAGGQSAVVDPQHYYRLNDFDWCASGCKGHIYAVRFDNTGPVCRIISMHRQLMNAPPGLLVDHENRISLDNRIDNLRLANRFQNACNCRIDKSKTSSRFRGVVFRKKSGRWVANIRVNGQKTWLGSFKSEIDAARAYDEAAKRYHREFARLNFPDGFIEPCQP